MSLLSFFPAVVTVVVAVIGALALHLVVGDRPERRLRRQLSLLGWFVLALVTLIITLPLGALLRGQILGLLGIVLSGAVALSSTTLLGNMLAGLMLRASRSFRLGDYIAVDDIQGRVTARSLIQVEIQTADRGLLTLPNLKLVKEPVKVLPSEGAVIHVEVSLGYDVSRDLAERSLLKATEAAGLTSPFVFIVSLGDFSVVYQVHGQLTDIGTLLTSRARLHAAVLDSLHAEGVEIVSPNFMNTRTVQERVFVPTGGRPAANLDESPSLLPSVDDQIFDKAEQAEGIAELRAELEAARTNLLDLDSQPAGENRDTNRTELEAQVEILETRFEAAKKLIEQ